MSPGDLLVLALLGAVVGLDVVSFPQVMISRPIVAGTLGGAAAGAPGAGLLVGAVLEVLALETLPVGASRYPEWGTAAVASGAVLAGAGEPRAAALALTTLGGLLIAWAGGWTMYALRRNNGRLAARHEAALEAGDGAAVSRLQLLGLGTDLARGAALTVVAVLALGAAVRTGVGLWSRGDRVSMDGIAIIVAAIGGGAAWTLVRGTPHARWLLLAGTVIGLGGMLVL